MKNIAKSSKKITKIRKKKRTKKQTKFFVQLDIPINSRNFSNFTLAKGFVKMSAT